MPFEPEGVYCSIPYRVLPDSSIEAMLPGGLVKFKSIELFLASSGSATANSNVEHPMEARGLLATDKRNVPAPTRPLDYYSILQEAIEAARHNSSQLRALVYDRARFNLKRDILYGHPTMGLAELVQQVKDFELAVARIEANVVEYEPGFPPGQIELPNADEPPGSGTIEILPAARAVPQYAPLNRIRWSDDFHHARWPDEFLRYVRSANRFIAFALLGIAIVGAVVIGATLWPLPKPATRIEVANKLPQAEGTSAKQQSPTAEASAGQSNSEPAAADATPKLPFPLPTSFGIYALNDNKLTELEALPINVPDPRVALSAEIRSPSNVTFTDHRPAFILFRRDLLNSAPQKVVLRVIARMNRETKIVNGKPMITNIEGAWRIRDISRELKIAPVPGQREMVMARLDDDTSLPAGRFALVVNRAGYDFTIDGPIQAPEFCLEGFEAANGAVFTQCRTP